VQMPSARSASETAPEALVSATQQHGCGARAGSTGVPRPATFTPRRDPSGPAATSTTCPSERGKTSTGDECCRRLRSAFDGIIVLSGSWWVSATLFTRAYWASILLRIRPGYAPNQPFPDILPQCTARRGWKVAPSITRHVVDLSAIVASPGPACARVLMITGIHRSRPIDCKR